MENRQSVGIGFQKDSKETLCLGAQGCCILFSNILFIFLIGMFDFFLICLCIFHLFSHDLYITHALSFKYTIMNFFLYVSSYEIIMIAFFLNDEL